MYCPDDQLVLACFQVNFGPSDIFFYVSVLCIFKKLSYLSILMTYGSFYIMDEFFFIVIQLTRKIIFVLGYKT